PHPLAPSPIAHPPTGRGEKDLAFVFGRWRPLSRGKCVRWERGSGGEVGRGKARPPRESASVKMRRGRARPRERRRRAAYPRAPAPCLSERPTDPPAGRCTRRPPAETGPP